MRLNKQLSKQSRRRWFGTPLHPLWRHCNAILCKVQILCILLLWIIYEWITLTRQLTELVAGHDANLNIFYVNICRYTLSDRKFMKDRAAENTIGIMHYPSILKCEFSLQLRHNELDSVSNHRRLVCLLNRLFRRWSKKRQSSASMAFVKGIHLSPVKSPHKGPITREMFPFNYVITFIFVCMNTTATYLASGLLTFWHLAPE